jgi:hypothetical protein
MNSLVLMPQQLQTACVEMVNTRLDSIPIHKKIDFKTVAIALRVLQAEHKLPSFDLSSPREAMAKLLYSFMYLGSNLEDDYGETMLLHESLELELIKSLVDIEGLLTKPESFCEKEHISDYKMIVLSCMEMRINQIRKMTWQNQERYIQSRNVKKENAEKALSEPTNQDYPLFASR